jgi:hypothetical protein
MNSIYQTALNLIYENPAMFVSWPKRQLLLLPGVTRETRYHQYPTTVIQQLRNAGITPDGRSNGPAICSFLLAGGVRQLRETGQRWHIHHIYDGKFLHPNKTATTHAVRDGQYFTEAAGLVALHPVANALADEFLEFAWWLRKEAFRRFGFDPDHVFQDQAGPNSTMHAPDRR